MRDKPTNRLCKQTRYEITAVRAILSRLSAFAADHAVAMLTVSHLNKAPGTEATGLLWDEDE